MKPNKLFLFAATILLMLIIMSCIKPTEHLTHGIPGVKDNIIFATIAPDNLLVYSIEHARIVHTLPADVRLNSMAIDEENMIAYVVTKNGYLNVFNLRRGDQITRIRIGTILQSVAISADKKYIAVGVGHESDYNAKDISVRLTSDVRQEVRRVALRGDIQKLVANPVRNELYIVNTNADKVRVFSFDTLELQRTIILRGSPSMFAVSPDGKKIYATLNARNAVVVIDTETHEHTARHELTGATPHYVAFTMDGSKVAITDREYSRIFFIDNINDEILGYKPFPDNLSRMLYAEIIQFSADGEYLYVISGRDNLFMVFDLEYMTMVQNYALPKQPAHVHVIHNAT